MPQSSQISTPRAVTLQWTQALRQETTQATGRVAHSCISPPHLPAFHILIFVQNFEVRQISTNLFLFIWSWSIELLGGSQPTHGHHYPGSRALHPTGPHWLSTGLSKIHKETNTPRHRWSVLDNTWAYLFHPNISCEAFNNAAGFLINTTLFIIRDLCTYFGLGSQQLH